MAASCARVYLHATLRHPPTPSSPGRRAKDSKGLKQMVSGRLYSLHQHLSLEESKPCTFVQACPCLDLSTGSMGQTPHTLWLSLPWDISFVFWLLPAVIYTPRLFALRSAAHTTFTPYTPHTNILLTISWFLPYSIREDYTPYLLLPPGYTYLCL